MVHDKYDSLIDEMLEGLEIVEAPEGFSSAVMAKVEALNLYAPKKSRILDILIFVPFVGVVATLIVLFINVSSNCLLIITFTDTITLSFTL